MCVIGPSGALFAKNSDRPAGEVQLVESFAPRPAGGDLRTQYLTIPDAGAMPFVGGRPHWLWGTEMGVNAAGVAIGNEKLLTTRDATATTPALIGMDLVRLCLEQAVSADDALDVLAAALAAHGQGGIADQANGTAYFSSFLIADATSGWVVETCGSSWWAAPAGERTAISNRISLRAADVARHSPDLDDGFDPQSFVDPDALLARADRRLACTTASVGEAATPADLVAALRDHGDGPWGRPGETASKPTPARYDDATAEGISVCMHLRGDLATTAAMVAELPRDGRPARVWTAVGSPCVSVFVPVFPPDGVPPVLGDADQWHRWAALRERVEGDPDALGEIRAVTGPLEAELWAEADSIADAHGAQATYLESIAPRLDAALRRLDA